jgi:para-nitrobenzyl esterase
MKSPFSYVHLNYTADTIYVVPNYRVGVTGYLATAPSEGGVSGNYGLLDQATALRWIQRHGGVG